MLKTVQKIGGDILTVTVYREKDLIYFDAYDPNTSKVFMTTIRVDSICTLLVPTKHARSLSQSTDILPPKTEKEMYVRLVKLLRFEKTSRTFNAG